jgi:hypothetical protein
MKTSTELLLHLQKDSAGDKEGNGGNGDSDKSNHDGGSNDGGGDMAAARLHGATQQSQLRESCNNAVSMMDERQGNGYEDCSYESGHHAPQELRWRRQ